MTAKEYLQEKYEWHKTHWNEHKHVDDEFTASEMEAYHQAKLKLLDIANVSKRSELLIGLLEMLEKEGGNEFINKAEIVAKYEANL